MRQRRFNVYSGMYRRICFSRAINFVVFRIRAHCGRGDIHTLGGQPRRHEYFDPDTYMTETAGALGMGTEMERVLKWRRTCSVSIFRNGFLCHVFGRKQFYVNPPLAR